MAYNFATQAYNGCIKPLVAVDVVPLRQATVRNIRSFDPELWFAKPIVSMIGSHEIPDSTGTVVDTTDAFGKVNGRMRLAAPDVVDQVLAHMSNFEPKVRDLREAVRKV